MELIPDILWILVSGYLYLKIYDFVSYTKEEKNYNYIFLKSVVCGTVLNATIGSLTGYIIEPWDTIAYIISVVIISFVLSKTMNSVLFRSILKKLNICRTFNQNIWHDLADRKHSVWVDLRSRQLERHYFGLLVLVEDFEKYPRIVLSRYTIYGKNNEIIEDYDKDPTQRIFIDTSLYDDIRLVYHNDSKNIK